MKLAFAILLIILLTSTTTFAQFDKDKLFYNMKAEKYKRMKTTGTILTIAGGVLTVVGFSTLANSTSTTNYNGYGSPQTTTTGNPEGGAIAFLLGIGGLGAGIPLWIVGAHAERKYLRKLENASIKFNHNNDRNSVSLTYRF